MTFFDKFFTIRNRNNKTENDLKLAVEPLRSLFDITKEQIRVVIFRECDRRGRKLLFDSDAVEKLPLGSHIKAKDNMCKTKCTQLTSGKFLDFVEVTGSHGYKYKKPCGDVTLLGEMIFGSVAMVFKGGNTCKIHSLASPRCVMFTNIVHAPGQCHYQLSSRHCTETSSGTCSLTSLSDNCSESRICSSDSKLYRPKCNATTNCSTSTYPCLRYKSVLRRLPNNCESEVIKSGHEKKSVFHKSSNRNCLEKMCFGELNDHERTSGAESIRSCFVNEFNSEQHSLSENSEVDVTVLEEKMEIYCNCGSSDVVGTCNGSCECIKDSSNANSVNSSLSSLRRRWMQSCSSSIDQIYFEDKDSMKNKARTKLGMGLVIDLTNSLEDELEKFLFNHTIIIESILNKLQSSIQTAYVRKENFVDLTYTAFMNCQQSVYELITGGKYIKPMWLSLTGMSTENMDSELHDTIYSQYHESIKDCKKQDSICNAKLKFLNDFCDILTKFDTKDTNFFISTLLTAVLTHHLSWVTGIAESDILLPQHKLQCVVKSLRPYNPIWAQLNDLNGILGSPLKSTRTVITGPEANKNNIASIVQVLTYFIRCYNVVENIYDFDIEEVTNIDEINVVSKDKEVEFEKLDCEIRRFYSRAPERQKAEHKSVSSETKTETCTFICEPDIHIVAPDLPGHTNKQNICSNTLQKSCAADGLKKSKSCLSRLEEECFAKDTTFYSDIDDCSGLKNISVGNVEYEDKSGKDLITDFLLGDVYSKKVQKLIRVPSKVISCHLEQNLSPDEGYDTVDSCTVAEVYPKAVEDEHARYPDNRENVLFVLGENEELVNLKKVVMTKSSVIDVEKEDSKELLTECRNMKLCRSKSVNIPISNKEDVAETRRTFHNTLGQTDKSVSRENYHIESEHSIRKNMDGVEKKMLYLHELPMPRPSSQKVTKRRLDVSSVLGSVNDHYNSEQIIQGVLADKNLWEEALRKDLALCAHNPVLDRNVTEALCIIGDMNSWEVSLCSSHNFIIDRSSSSGMRIGMSQLVADMLESFLYIWRIKLPPDFCLNYIEKKLHEIYSKSKSVAELLNSTERCSMEYLTSRLDISVNDVPLLLSVATTHSPNISSKYGLTFT